MAKLLGAEPSRFDVELEINEGKEVYGKEKAKEVQTKEEYYAEKSNNILLLREKGEKDGSEIYMNDNNEKYDYFDFNEIKELKELGKLLKIKNSTKIDIDFNNLNKGDIVKISQNIRERYEKLEEYINFVFNNNEELKLYFNSKNGFIYKKFIKISTDFHKNLLNLDSDEKRHYLDYLEFSLNILTFYEDMINTALKHTDILDNK